MKYETEVEIILPRKKVIELFDSSDNMFKWQKGLLKFEHLNGEKGQVGAKSKLVYKMGSRKMEMIETITKRNLPDEFHGTYETSGVWNNFENYFSELDGGNTRWKTVSEFRFTSFFMKLLAAIVPGIFKKQTLKTMLDFKVFAEENAN